MFRLAFLILVLQLNNRVSRNDSFVEFPGRCVSTFYTHLCATAQQPRKPKRLKIVTLEKPESKSLINESDSSMTFKNTLAIFLCFFLCLSTYNVKAQADTLLGKFSLSESNGQVAISWQMLAGNTCNGIQIFRSINGTDFSRIGVIPGICGSVSEPVNYFFTDTMPIQNAINYYYLEFGGFGATQVIAIEIINMGEDGYHLRPHPFQNTGTIYFESSGGQEYILHIYDLNGKEILVDKTSDNHFEVITSDFIPGQYIFTISGSVNRGRIKGKLLVQH